jgi:hypothetical protein
MVNRYLFKKTKRDEIDPHQITMPMFIVSDERTQTLKFPLGYVKVKCKSSVE